MADCIFCKLANGEIPTDIVAENELACAFRDMNPQAPVHVLVVPKAHYANIVDSVPGDVLAAMGEMDESTKELIRKLAGNVVSKTVEAAASAWQAAWEAVSSRMPSGGAPSTSS